MKYCMFKLKGVWPTLKKDFVSSLIETGLLVVEMKKFFSVFSIFAISLLSPSGERCCSPSEQI
jgi:hypothetical protein